MSLREKKCNEKRGLNSHGVKHSQKPLSMLHPVHRLDPNTHGLESRLVIVVLHLVIRTFGYCCGLTNSSLARNFSCFDS